MKFGKGKKSVLHLTIACFAGFYFSGLPFSHQDSGAEPIEVAEILKAASAYCRKLENVAFHFVCQEEITEKIDFTRDIVLSHVRQARRTWNRTQRLIRKIENTYVFDYQLIRKNGHITEIRTLLEENGKKKHEKDSSLKTQSFQFKNAIIGPVGILGERWQFFYNHKIVGEEQVNGKPAIILEITPIFDFQAEFLFGKVWFNKNNFDILKIEWSPQRIGHYAVFERRGQSYNSKPCITLISEFQVTKNGIRFPSYFHIEEAYVKKNKKFIRSETTVVYRDFKFFTVEIEVIH